MVSHCANPDCRRELRYLRDGKIYQFGLSPKTGGKGLEHFWFCGECFKNMTLICVNQSEVKTARKERTGLTTYERLESWPTPTRRSVDLVKSAKIAISPVRGKGLAEFEVAFTNP